MTEDEAFIRTIVDRPGDDLPRLVYADWLDERNDERGSYLRTEMELVRNDDFGGLEALRRSLVTIADFDVVWAARVSRPPAGVCCDHLRIRDCGPCSAEDLTGVEAELGASLSHDLVAFVQNYNGGSEWSRIVLPNGGGRFDYTLDWFVRGVNTPAGSGVTLLEQSQEFWEQEFDLEAEAALAPTLLPFGCMNGLLLFERMTTDDAGAIGICDVIDGELSQMRRLAPNLASFLDMLALRAR